MLTTPEGHVDAMFAVHEDMRTVQQDAREALAAWTAKRLRGVKQDRERAMARHPQATLNLKAGV